MYSVQLNITISSGSAGGMFGVDRRLGLRALAACCTRLGAGRLPPDWPQPPAARAMTSSSKNTE